MNTHIHVFFSGITHESFKCLEPCTRRFVWKTFENCFWQRVLYFVVARALPLSLLLLFTMFLFSHIYAYALPARCGVALQKSVAAGSATWRRHAQSALHNANLTNSLAHIWHRGGGGVEGVANTCVALVQKRRRRGNDERVSGALNRLFAMQNVSIAVAR